MHPTKGMNSMRRLQSGETGSIAGHNGGEEGSTTTTTTTTTTIGKIGTYPWLNSTVRKTLRIKKQIQVKPNAQ